MGRPKGKLTKGQPRGSRTASGRKRDRAPLRIVPCEGIERRNASYGIAANDANACDAIGRAYAAGFLGEGDAAKDLLNIGRAIGARWRIVYTVSPHRDSLLRFQKQDGSGLPPTPEEEKARELLLGARLKRVRDCGAEVSRYFGELVLEEHADHGPMWMDSLIWAKRQNRAAYPLDEHRLAKAIEGLEAIA